MESGKYALPEDHDGSPFTLIDRSRLCFEDPPEVASGRGPRLSRAAGPTEARPPEVVIQPN
jgi:hypothetical protein